MALSQADLQVIQTVFGKTAEEISGALSSQEEVSLGLKLAGKVYTPEEVETLKRVNQDAGIEIGFKKIAKAAGVELEAGEKEAETIATKLRTALETSLADKFKNMTPTEELTAALTKAKSWEDKYNVLNGTYEKEKENSQKYLSDLNNFRTEIAEQKRDSEILSYFPDKLGQDRGDALLIVKHALKSEEVDGVMQHKVNGQLITDAVGNPAPLKDVVAKIIEDKGWVRGQGKGGSDDKGEGKTYPTNLSDEEAIAYLKKQGIEPMSPKGSELIIELTKDHK